MSEQPTITEQPSAPKARRQRTAVVISNKMQKTVVVEYIRRVEHGKYGKYMKRRFRFKAHDERQECQIGDTVLLEQTRPLSRDKRWRVRSIVKKAEATA